MERKRKTFSTHGKAARILSFVLAFAMMITMSAFSNMGSIVAKADSAIRLYFELPDGTSAGDWGVNAWSNVSVAGNTDVTVSPSGWGIECPTLLEDSDLPGWGYVTVSGTVSGLQFVNAEANQYNYNCWNEEIAKQGYTTAYYSTSDRKWYSDAEKTSEIKAVAVNLYFELPEGTSATDWCANIWGDGIVVTGDYDNAFRPSTWGDGDTFPALLADENLPGWGYVTVAGSIEGLQFVDAAGDEYKVWDTAISEFEFADAYYSPESSAWYTSSDKSVAIHPVTLYFELPEGTTASDWAANVWGSSIKVIGDSDSAFRPSTWGDGEKCPALVASKEGWGSVRVNGSIEGMQFVNAAEKEYYCWSKKAEGYDKVYYSPADDKWYVDADKTTEVGDGDVPTFDKATITLHFDNSADWDLVNAYITCATSWNQIEGYAYAGNWPGAEVEADAKNDGWYSFTITMANDQFNCIFNNGNGEQTGNINLIPEQANTEIWVYANGTAAPTLETSAPDGWISCASNAPINPNADSSIVSPIVNADNTVTITLDATGKYADAESVDLMGTLAGTDWTDGLAMEKDGDVYTVTTPVQTPGVYEYKIRIDQATWITDPMNEQLQSGNSKVVIAGLAGTSLDVVKAKDTALPATLKFYDKDGNASDVAVTYTLADADDADAVSIFTEDDAAYINISDTVDAATITLNATYTDASGTSYVAEISIVPVDVVYTYHIYYYDYNEAHMDVAAADIWTWEVGGAGLDPVSFTSVETLEDGNTWLKATLKTSATSLGFIPRSAGAWDWQTENHYFTNTEEAESCDIYIVYGDNETYSTLPSIKEVRDRYVIVEYERTDNDYEGWNIYSWNTGFGSETELYCEEVRGKQYIIIPVKDSEVDFRLAFCMRQTIGEDTWAQKDGGDHYIDVPADQVVVKAKFVQGQGIVSVAPYNTGYEMMGAQDQIAFYYRDDARMLTNEEALLEDVQVVVNGKSYDMTYSSENERYEAVLNGCESGDYQYYYLVNGEKVLDIYNPNYSADDEYSVLTYKKFDSLSIKATLANESMDYNDNNVITISFVGDDASTISTSEIASVQVNQAALGLGVLSVEPELMQATISCLDSVAAGKKVIPVTVKDIYGNIYKTNVTVTVTERDKSGDFDWDEAVVYFAVTDRFFDGNTDNNEGVDKDGSLSYHGGDFAGLQQKLDYLQELGVNTIWITPIVANSDVTTEKDGEVIESTGYHGYWASDFTNLNSHLGTEEEFAALIDAVHARGMKLMVDVVLNHAGYNTEDYFNTLILNDETGEYYTMLRDSSTTVSGDDVYSSLSGLPDFLTEDAEVREQLIEWQTSWMSNYDIDYYRVDTVKHVDSVTWKAFKNALAEINPDFKMIGEESGSGYASNSANLGTGAMDALLDFDFNDFAQSFLSGSISSIESSLVARNATINNTKTLGSFINSHDEDGLQYKLQVNAGMTEEQTLKLMKVAESLVLTAKGIPVIYYGEEIGLYGQDNYPYQTNRYDFDWDELAKQQADSNSLYNHYKTMLAIRNAYTDVFAKGTRTTIAASDEEGYDVFSRSYGDTTLYVGLNIADEAKSIEIPVAGEDGALYNNLYDGTLYAVAGGKITVTIPAANDGGTVVLAIVKNEAVHYVPVTDAAGFDEVVDAIAGLDSEDYLFVDLFGTTVVPQKVFEALKGKNIDVYFQIPVTYYTNGTQIRWKVNGKNITVIKGDIDFGVTFKTNNIPAASVKAVAGDKTSTQMSLAYSGDFGMIAQMYVDFGTELTGKYANLFYYNPTQKALSYVQNFQVDADGFAAFSFTHASDYLIVMNDAVMSTVTSGTTPEQNGTINVSTSTNTNTATVPDTAKADVVTAENVKTGDSFPIFPFVLLFIIGGALAGYGVYRKKKVA